MPLPFSVNLFNPLDQNGHWLKSLLQNPVFSDSEATISKLTIDNGQLTIVDAGCTRANFLSRGVHVERQIPENG